MNDLTVSLNQNLLKLSLSGKDGISTYKQELSADVVNDSKIQDTKLFATVLNDSIKQLTKISSKKLNLRFLLEPDEVNMMFVTANKRDGIPEDQILTEIKSKLGETQLDYMYYSHQKIAPFAYQFIGIKKDVLDKLLEISAGLGSDLKGIYPWVALLPKFVNKNDPCIFISKDNEKQMVALSELNGVYFIGLYEVARTPSELSQLVEQLSFYKRPTPITKIYALNYDAFTIDPRYDVSQLVIENALSETNIGFEHHLVLYSLLADNPDFDSTQVNLLNLVLVPVVEKKNLSLVMVGTTLVIGALVLGGLGIYGFGLNTGKQDKPDKLAINSTNIETPAVLSESSQSTQTTQSVKIPEVSKLNKKDLAFRIENGSGVSGAAAKARDYMVAKGYNPAEIATATSNIETTKIKVKTSKIAFKELIIEDLKGSYTATVENGLDEKLSYDVLIVLGAR